jgi:hypothetical protein
MKSCLVFWFTVGLLILNQFQDRRWKALEVFDWDMGGYYSYLPATFLYDDLGRADSLALLVQAHKQQRVPGVLYSATRLGIHRLLNGKSLAKYPLGVALSELPWFGGAHLYARLHGDVPNGFSRPYQQAMMVAGLFYGILGLWVVRKLLHHYYSDAVTAWALAGIGLGTNFFSYASFEAAMSHAVLFLWQASLLYCTVRWYEAPRRRWAVGIGLFLGLATLTRFTEAIYGLIPLTWGLSSAAAWRQRPGLLSRHVGQVALAGGLALAVVSIQFCCWYAVSGHWLVDGYAGEYFDFGHPHLQEGLFSFRKGWLLYTPLMGLTLGLGLFSLRRYVPVALPPAVILLPPLFYLTFSWEQWWYGGGFSARTLISVYPLLALPLGALVAVSAACGRWPKVGVRLLLVACIGLNLWQTWQYMAGILPYDNTTAALYQERFFWFRMHPTVPASNVVQGNERPAN